MQAQAPLHYFSVINAYTPLHYLLYLPIVHINYASIIIIFHHSYLKSGPQSIANQICNSCFVRNTGANVKWQFLEIY